jgi:5-methylcytosine-specific restriction endonuclease McrA
MRGIHLSRKNNYMPRVRQRVLFCGCGRPGVIARGRCSRCYTEWRRFGGLRHMILSRDGAHCSACGRFQGLVVHHRRPGANQARFLLTLCRRCHARLHRTFRPRYGFPVMLRVLWREQHRGLAEQRELALAGEPEDWVAPEQAFLFEA